ncbi:hypothetical protein D910_09855, partial [Dendroctonus ponderosae]
IVTTFSVNSVRKSGFIHKFNSFVVYFGILSYQVGNMIEEHKEEILQSMNGDTAIIVQLLKEIQEKENINNELTQKIDQVTLEEARKKTYLRRCEEQSRDGTQRINDAIKVALKMEKVVLSNCNKLIDAKQAINNSANDINNIQQQIADANQKCNQAKDFIESLRANNASLMSKLEELEQQLALGISNYNALEEQYSKIDLKKDEQELEENRKTIAHADSLIKNLEDMIKQQEAQLQQKVKECASVTALFDDILSTS